MTVGPPTPQKVFGLGLARTGTTAMHQAMGILRYRSAPSSAELIDGLDDEFLASYDAFFDNPVPFLRPELAERFPEARFVVTWRPVEPWLDSMAWLFGPGLDRLDPATRALGDRVHRSVYGFDRFDRARLQAIHEEHYDDLRRWSSDADNVLWLDQSEGFTWGPLCRFLDVSEPTVPFPVANTAQPDRPLSRYRRALSQRLDRLRRRGPQR